MTARIKWRKQFALSLSAMRNQAGPCAGQCAGPGQCAHVML